MTSPDIRPLHSSQVQLVGIRKASQAGRRIAIDYPNGEKEVSSVLVTVENPSTAPRQLWLPGLGSFVYQKAQFSFSWVRLFPLHLHSLTLPSRSTYDLAMLAICTDRTLPLALHGSITVL